MSCTKEAWQAGGTIRLVAMDGTFTTTGYFSSTILLAVAYDGNNELVILAHAVVSGENEENWCWFLDLVLADFPK